MKKSLTPSSMSALNTESITPRFSSSSEYWNFSWTSQSSATGLYSGFIRMSFGAASFFPLRKSTPICVSTGVPASTAVLCMSLSLPFLRFFQRFRFPIIAQSSPVIKAGELCINDY